MLIREGSGANYNITVKTGRSGEERRGEKVGRRRDSRRGGGTSAD